MVKMAEKRHFVENIAIKLGGDNPILQYISILLIIVPVYSIHFLLLYLTGFSVSGNSLNREIVWAIVNIFFSFLLWTLLLWSFSEFRKIFNDLDKVSANRVKFNEFKNVWLNRILNPKGSILMSLVSYIIFFYPIDSSKTIWLSLYFLLAPIVFLLIIGPGLWFMIIYFLCLRDFESLELNIPIVNNYKLSNHALNIAQKLSLAIAILFTTFNLTVLFTGHLGANEIIFINDSLEKFSLYFWIKEAIVISAIIGTFMLPAYFIKKVNSKNRTKYLEEIAPKITCKQEFFKNGEFSIKDINYTLTLRKFYNEIVTTSDWPFDYKMALKIFVSSLLPILSNLVSGLITK